MDINYWLPVLVDPETKIKLIFKDDILINAEGKQYSIHNNKPYFLKKVEEENFNEQKDKLDKFKTIVKNILGKYYILFTYLISPVIPKIHWGSLSNYFTYYCKQAIKGKSYAIQIGSGNSRIDKSILNIDIFDYIEVDMVADCTKLPFAENCIDCVINYAFLEHVANPEIFIKEAQRVLKPGGIIISGVPFIQGFHASPNDYTRWTDTGLVSVHERYGFEKKIIIPGGGPTSGFLWILQEWLAIVLSFNISILYQLWWYFFLVVLMPIKLLDLLLINYKESRKIASFFIYVGTKK